MQIVFLDRASVILRGKVVRWFSGCESSPANERVNENESIIRDQSRHRCAIFLVDLFEIIYVSVECISMISCVFRIPFPRIEFR